MATAPDIFEPDTAGEEEAPERSGKLTILDILNADNLAEVLPEIEVTAIGQRCLREFEQDLLSRNSEDDPQSWEQRYDKYLDIAMQVRKAKTFPWPGAANIKFPALTTGAIQFQARSYPVIVDGANLVKGRVLGPDPEGVKRERADRVGQHMTWQLMYDMPGWEESTDRLLLMLPIVGCVFRKTFHDDVQNQNVSKLVTAKDFVINYWAESIEAAPRFTHILRYYPYEVEERIRSGIWSDIGKLPDGRDDKDDSDTAPVEFLEQNCRMDLDDDGYPEPYVVTLVRESGKVARIVPCFDADGVTIDQDRGGQVVRIEPKQYFTKYGFIPSPDGAFYDIGFGSLLDDITAGIDTTLNQLLDAGALQNAQGGFIGNGVNMRSGDMRIRLGEWKRVDVTGGNLRDNIVPLTLPGPSAVLFNLLNLLIEQAKAITSVQDILSGAGVGATTPATTVLAQIEQATKVMTAIFKRIHRSFGQELRILFGLNRDYLDEQAYFALNDQPGEVGRADYQDDDVDVVPISDPTMINDAQRAMRAQALLAFNGDPLVNQIEIRQRYFEGTGQPDIKKLMTVPQPPPPAPDPKALLDAVKQRNDRDETMARIADMLSDAAVKLGDLGLAQDAAVLAGEATRIGSSINLEAANDPDQSGGNGPVAPAAGDAGVLPVPGGPPGGPDVPMGGGGAAGLGGAGAGGDALQAPEPQGV